jgi:hypothetical protein
MLYNLTHKTGSILFCHTYNILCQIRQIH